MIIDTTNDELLINGQRWQRGGYLLATAYATDQINITARDGRVIGKAIEWDRILDKDKNTFGLDRDGTVTALTNIFNSQVKSPYKIDALRDVENGTAAYGEIMIYRSPGEWQYEVLEQYHGAYDSEAATLRSGATATLELYYTAQADGDGISELSQSNTPASGYQIIRKLYYAERAQQDPDTGTWVQFADLAANTSFNDAKTALLAYLKERTGGTVPISLKMTWEEVEIYNGLLDSYGGAAAAYSVRRLSSTYTGPLIEVERASDSTTQDIGYDANGDLDTTALATFCSGTTCTVRTWYDQSSNGNDAVQTTQADQPKIYDSSTGVIEKNGKPAFITNNSVNVLNTTALAGLSRVDYYAVYSVTDVDYTTASAGTVTSGYACISGASSSSAAFNFGSPTYYVNGTSLGAATRQDILNNTTDGSQKIVTHEDGSTATWDNWLFFSRGQSSSLNASDAKIHEAIIYDSDQSSNRSGIETNINDYFGIYTPFTTGLLDDYGGAAAAYSLRRLSSTYTGPLIRVRRASDNAEQDISADIEGNLNTAALAAFCSGTNGFVKTWYDQSGNGNDAEQTTTSAQGKIYDSGLGVFLDPDTTKPSIEFGLGNSRSMTGSITLAQPMAYYVVAKSESTSGVTERSIFVENSGSTHTWGVDLNGKLVAVCPSVIIESTSQTRTATELFTFTCDGASSGLYANGTLAVSGDVGTNGLTGTQGVLISRGDRPPAYVSEFIIFDNTSNRAGIETDINDFYSIYP